MSSAKIFDRSQAWYLEGHTCEIRNLKSSKSGSGDGIVTHGTRPVLDHEIVTLVDIFRESESPFPPPLEHWGLGLLWGFQQLGFPWITLREKVENKRTVDVLEVSWVKRGYQGNGNKSIHSCILGTQQLAHFRWFRLRERSFHFSLRSTGPTCFYVHLIVKWWFGALDGLGFDPG